MKVHVRQGFELVPQPHWPYWLVLFLVSVLTVLVLFIRHQRRKLRELRESLRMTRSDLEMRKHERGIIQTTFNNELNTLKEENYMLSQKLAASVMSVAEMALEVCE